MKGLNYNRQLLVCGILFTLHNIEESVGYAHFTFPSGIKLPFTPPAVQPMVASIVAITFIAWLIILIAKQSKRENSKRDVLAVITTVFLINAIFPHLSSAIALQRYTPAVATSVLLYLPYVFVVLPKLYRNYQPGAMYFKLAITWVIITGLLTVGLQIIMKLIFE
jgi:hypothetical protein